MQHWLILIPTHLVILAIGFAGGIYTLPILTAAHSPSTPVITGSLDTWVNALVESYAAADILGLSCYSNLQALLARGLARPAVPRGLHIPASTA